MLNNFAFLGRGTCFLSHALSADTQQETVKTSRLGFAKSRGHGAVVWSGSAELRCCVRVSVQ